MNVVVRARAAIGGDFISLCTGGGGLDLGIELAAPGARAVCVVEREAFACAHLVAAMRAGLLAPAPIWSDARTFDGRRWRGCVDGVIGGIPCQPHSLAGKRRGAEDERDLWPAARRIIVQSGAWWALIENVGGMLTSGGAERLWRDFRRLGFAIEGGLFAAEEVGAPHERQRLFILAVADVGDSTSAARRWPRGAEEALGQRAAAWWLEFGRSGCGAVADTDIAELRRQQAARQFASDERDAAPGLFPPGPGDIDGWRSVLERAPELEPAVRRSADGLAAGMDRNRAFRDRIDRLRMLGNGVVPLAAAHAFRTLVLRLAARGSRGAARLAALMS